MLHADAERSTSKETKSYAEQSSNWAEGLEDDDPIPSTSDKTSDVSNIYSTSEEDGNGHSTIPFDFADSSTTEETESYGEESSIWAKGLEDDDPIPSTSNEAPDVSNIYCTSEEDGNGHSTIPFDFADSSTTEETESYGEESSIWAKGLEDDDPIPSTSNEAPDVSNIYCTSEEDGNGHSTIPFDFADSSTTEETESYGEESSIWAKGLEDDDPIPSTSNEAPDVSNIYCTSEEDGNGHSTIPFDFADSSTTEETESYGEESNIWAKGLEDDDPIPSTSNEAPDVSNIYCTSEEDGNGHSTIPFDFADSSTTEETESYGEESNIWAKGLEDDDPIPSTIHEAPDVSNIYSTSEEDGNGHSTIPFDFADSSTTEETESYGEESSIWAKGLEDDDSIPSTSNEAPDVSNIYCTSEEDGNGHSTIPFDFSDSSTTEETESYGEESSILAGGIKDVGPTANTSNRAPDVNNSTSEKNGHLKCEKIR